ncbi:DNA sulfur modification protein DndD [Nitrincola sp.]|uniref:DNA sulfur modification protein DndD n=1 Tax=Nitrincola sp. TaxID=1926584 RepID=UPI003A8E6CF4
MIIKKLVLHNFRVFRGVHEVDLQPTVDRFGHAKPIVLFGGLNGAGKTSILSAVRTVLYGRQAFGRTLSQNEYTDQLDALIHKGEGQGSRPDQASIELVFTFAQDGEESEYVVIRSWKRGKRDRLSIVQNGEPRSELNYDQCQGFLNELIPAGIADLFFFDGEKIAELAEDESGTILQTAVKRLLGIDLINRLKSDLEIYLKRQGAEALPQKIIEELNAISESRTTLDRVAEGYRNEAALKETSITGAAARIAQLEAVLSAEGGAWAQSKESETAKVKTLDNEKVRLEKAIRLELDGLLPLALAPNTMKSLLDTLEQEAIAKQKQHVSAEVGRLREQLQSALAGVKAIPEEALNAINQCFVEQLSPAEAAPVLLDLSDREYRLLEQQFTEASESAWSRFDADRKALKKTEYELDNASLNIARAPDEEQLQSTFEEIRQLERERVQHQVDYRQALLNAKDTYRKALELARKEQKLHDKHRALTNSSEGVSNAQKALLLLDRFAELLTHTRVKKLEVEFMNSYQQLARKEDLNIHARINAKSFDVELVDDQEQVINRKELSAGEKQIYAIAILEALGRTSGRKLPVIIDTPLGRLDSHHRDKLVQFYFPSASHQVVILSTDTEIDNGYFEELEDDISHGYEIVFDGHTKSSRLSEGYFWKSAQQEAI